MKRKTIYLAGRMDGLSYEDAMTWRYKAKSMLYNFDVYIPHYGFTLDNKNLMWDRDYFMEDNCDILIVNFDYEKENPFLGTSMEIGRAYYQRKPIIIFSTKQWVKDSLTLQHHASAIVNTLEEAVEIANEFI